MTHRFRPVRNLRKLEAAVVESYPLGRGLFTTSHILTIVTSDANNVFILFNN